MYLIMKVLTGFAEVSGGLVTMTWKKWMLLNIKLPSTFPTHFHADWRVVGDSSNITNDIHRSRTPWHKRVSRSKYTWLQQIAIYLRDQLNHIQTHSLSPSLTYTRSKRFHTCVSIRGDDIWRWNKVKLINWALTVVKYWLISFDAVMVVPWQGFEGGGKASIKIELGPEGTEKRRKEAKYYHYVRGYFLSLYHIEDCNSPRPFRILLATRFGPRLDWE